MSTVGTTLSSATEDTWLTMPEVLRAHADGCDTFADKKSTPIRQSLAAIEEGVRLRAHANALDAVCSACKGCGADVGEIRGIREAFVCGSARYWERMPPLCMRCEGIRTDAIRALIEDAEAAAT